MAGTVGDTSADSQLSNPASSPWLFSLRSSRKSGPDRALALRISRKNDSPSVLVFDEKIPKRYRDHYLITSQGRYIYVEDSDGGDGIYLLDPFSSWAQVHKFPGGDPRSKILNHFDKVATDGRVAVAIAGIGPTCLVYTASDSSDPHWILRNKMYGSFSDLVYHKAHGLFYAMDNYNQKVVSLKFASEIQDDDGDVDLQDITLDLGRGVGPSNEGNNRGWCFFQFANLVVSPSDLFVVRWRMLLKRGEQKRRELDVYRLSADSAGDKTWARVDSLGDYSFFLGSNQSLAASSEDFPQLRTNLVYIPYDASYRVDPDPIDVEDYIDADDCMDEVEYNLIYDMEDKSWHQWDRCVAMDVRDREGVEWPAVWMMPPRLGESAPKWQ